MILKFSRLFIVLVLTSLFYNCMSQDFIISTTRNTYAYCNLCNPLSVSYCGDYEKLILKSDNGKIEKMSKSNYCWTPTKPISTKISLYKILAGDTILIGSQIFDVVNILPIITISNSSDCIIEKESLKKLIAINYFWPDNIYIDGNYEIVSFSVVIIRSDSVVYFSKNATKYFSKQTISAIEQTVSGDIIGFFDINFRAGEMSYLLKPVELHVK